MMKKRMKPLVLIYEGEPQTNDITWKPVKSRENEDFTIEDAIEEICQQSGWSPGEYIVIND